MADTTETGFEVQGGFEILDSLEKHLSYDGEVVGYITKAGETIRLCMALEIENPDGTFRYVTSTREMDKLGFQNLDYKHLTFYPEV